jgi:hypothetical protein
MILSQIQRALQEVKLQETLQKENLQPVIRQKEKEVKNEAKQSPKTRKNGKKIEIEELIIQARAKTQKVKDKSNDKLEKNLQNRKNKAQK